MSSARLKSLLLRPILTADGLRGSMRIAPLPALIAGFNALRGSVDAVEGTGELLLLNTIDPGALIGDLEGAREDDEDEDSPCPS